MRTAAIATPLDPAPMPSGAAWRALWELLCGAGLIGLIHCLAETLVLTLFDVRTAWLDPLLGFVLICGAAAVALTAALVALRLSAPRLLHPPDDPVILARRMVLLSSLVGYGVGCVLITNRNGQGPVGLGVAAALALLWTPVWRIAAPRLRNFGVLAAAVAVVVLTALQGAAWAFSTTPFQRSYFAGTLILAIVVLVALWRTAGRPTRPEATLTLLAGVLTLLSLGLFAFARRAPLQIRPIAEHAARPNVILIVLDTVNASHLELFGSPRSTMPRLTEFARDCQVVMTITATAPVTPPSHASMFTGLWPHQHGCRRTDLAGPGQPYAWCQPLRPDVQTLAGWLGKLGYQTIGIAANYSLAGTGIERGFEQFEMRPAWPDLQDLTSHDALCWSGYLLRRVPALRRWIASSAAGRWSGAYEPFPTPYRRGDEITRRASARLRRRAEGGEQRPYFLFLNYMDAHTPYFSRRAFAELSRLSNEELPQPWEVATRFWRMGAKPSRAACDSMSHFYGEALRDLDDYVCDLLQTLRASGELDHSIVIITSDHGEEFGEHGQLDHQSNVFEPQVRVPLLIRLPESLRPPPPVPPHLQFVDILPTIAALLDAPPPRDLAGLSWAAGRDEALTELSTHPSLDERVRGGMLGIVRGHYKYIRMDSGEEMLFDLASDPAELHNLLGTASEDALRFFRERARARDDATWHAPPAGPMDEDLQRRLKSLGYAN